MSDAGPIEILSSSEDEAADVAPTPRKRLRRPRSGESDSTAFLGIETALSKKDGKGSKARAARKGGAGRQKRVKRSRLAESDDSENDGAEPMEKSDSEKEIEEVEDAVEDSEDDLGSRERFASKGKQAGGRNEGQKGRAPVPVPGRKRPRTESRPPPAAGSILKFMQKQVTRPTTGASASSCPSLTAVKKAQSNGSRAISAPPESASVASRTSSAKCAGTELWTDRHVPNQAAELAIPPKKVNEVRQWLIDALAPTAARKNKLLLLRGPPGVGKSTMVHLLAEELGMKILSWSEASTDLNGQWGRRGAQSSSGSEEWSRMPQDEYVSHAEDFRDFLRASAYRPLELASASQKDVAHSAEQTHTIGGNKRLFLLEELPYHESERTAAHFRGALATFLSESAHPAVLVFTEENEDRYGSAELERLLTREVLQSPYVQQIHCNPVTDANMRKALARVAAAEGVMASHHDIEAAVVSSRGDVRHGILTLQMQLVNKKETRPPSFRKVGGGRGSKAKQAAQQATGSLAEDKEKDLYLSNFHAIGKVLHAKREPSPVLREAEAPDGTRGRLSFMPEEQLGRCDMTIDTLSAFVQTHCIEHFGRMDHLADALALLSDADMFVARLYSTNFVRDSSDQVYPTEYAVSLVGRTVAETNREPVKPKGGFRPLTAPRYYECNRARREGLRRLAFLCTDVAQDLTHSGVSAIRLTSREMISEIVPYAKMIGSGPAVGKGFNGSCGSKTSAEDTGAESLVNALSFLRLFNRRLCPQGSAPAAAAEELGSGVPAPSDLEVDDISDN